ncbi:MAG: hypothetical protein PHU14_09095 [Methylovulum sp.]|nr:hypothetical protein [Methylovulum sp.]
MKKQWNATMRETPFEYLRFAVQETKRRSGAVIVEIGCMRQRFNHPIEQEPDTCPSRCDGHSTVHFAATGLEVYSVDINRQAVIMTREYVKDYQKTHIVEYDGIKFLKMFGKKIDLLFLDAWDVDLMNCAEKHLEAYSTAKKKLKDSTLIMIDDCDVDMIDGKLQPSILSYGGKGRLVVPQAINDGFKVIKKGRCVILSK